MRSLPLVLALALATGALARDKVGLTDVGISYLTLIDTVTPATPVIALANGASQSFKVQCLGAPDDKLEGEWFLDGLKVEGGTRGQTARGPVFELTLGPDRLMPTRRELRFLATDQATAKVQTERGVREVRRRPNQRSWILVIKSTDPLPKLRVVNSSFMQ